MPVVERLSFRDVEGVRVGRFPGRINTTCIVYRLGDLVFDTGPPNQWRWVARFLEERQVTHVVLTHHHEDHGGNGARVQQQTGLPVLAPPGSAAFVENGFKVHLYRRIVWGRPLRFSPQPLAGSLLLNDREPVLPIDAPGHSPDMTCFLLPERGWLFSGDLYISSRPKFLRRDENPRQEIESLRRVLERDFDVVFCAHRGIVEHGRQALQDKLDFYLELQQRISELRQQGKSIRQITRELLGREEVLSWLTAFHFSKRNLIEKLMPETF